MRTATSISIIDSIAIDFDSDMGKVLSGAAD